MRYWRRAFEKRRHWVIAGLIFLLCVTLFWQTAARYPTATADSDELIGVSYVGGLLHPPGYPILRSLLYIFTNLLIWWPLAFRANVLAVILGALTSVGLFLALRRFLRLSYPKVNLLWVEIAALFTVLSISFSYLYWFYAGVIEVSGLTSLFMVALIFGGLVIYEDTNEKRKIGRFLWWCGLYGLSLSHHQLIILLAPGFVVLFWDLIKLFRKHKSYLLASVLTVFLGLMMPYLMTVFFNGQDVEWTWRLKPGISGMMEYILRRDFAGNFIEIGIEKTAYLSRISLQGAKNALFDYFLREIPTNFHWSFMVLVIVGLVKMLTMANRRYVTALMIFMVMSNLVLVAYLGHPEHYERVFLDAHRLVINERFFLMGGMALSFAAAIGLVETGKIVFKLFGQRKMVVISMGLIMGVVIAESIFRYYPMVNMADYRVVDEYASNLIDKIDENAVVLCHTDVTCFLLLYKKVETDNYSGINIIPVTPQIEVKNWIDDSELSQFDYPDNPFRIADVISWNIFGAGRRVVLADINPIYFDLFGMDAKLLKTLPYHGGYEISCSRHLEMRDPTLLLNFNGGYFENSSKRMFALYIAEYHATAATILGRLQQKDFALAHIQKGLSLNDDNQMLHSLEDELTEFEGDRRYMSFDNCQTGEEIMNSDEICVENEGDCVGKKLLWRVMRRPKNADYRFEWAAYLHDRGFLSLAKREYKHVLELEESHSDADEALKSLDAVDDLPIEL